MAHAAYKCEDFARALMFYERHLGGLEMNERLNDESLGCLLVN